MTCNQFVANRLREIRLERNLTQVQMAETLGCAATYYARRERNRQDLSLDDLWAFSRALGVDVRELWPPAHAVTERFRP